MGRLPARLRRTIWVLGLVLPGVVLFLASMIWSPNLGPVGALPLAQATPTCPPDNCDGYQPRINGYQPYRDEIRAVFNAAAANALGNAGPTYDPIAYGRPPVQWVNVSSDRPIPHIVLRGIAWQESRWKQFADDKDNDPDGEYYCTLMSVAGDCGYGLVQITWCMTHPGECSWLDREKTAGDQG